MEILVTLIFLLLGALGLALLGSLTYFALFNTAAVRRRQLNHQAQQDYTQARGTAHRRLLEDAARQLKHQQQLVQHQLTSVRAAQDSLLRLRESELDVLLDRHLIQNHLQEVPGIGDKRKALILAAVYKNDLADLHHAQMLQGIGEQLQFSINQWVARYKSRWPALRQQDFLGKSAVLEKYHSTLAEHDQRSLELETTQLALNESLTRINQELAWLRQVSASDFARSLNGSPGPNPSLGRYLQGVFAEWEPMPDWFRAVVSTEVN